MMCFKKREFKVRRATIHDLPQLLHLERSCWKESCRLHPEVISRRLSETGETVFVAEFEQVVKAVLYAQPITFTGELPTNLQVENVSSLFDPKGNCLQLLALNVDPVIQGHAIGDHLRSFGLQHAFFAGLQQAIAVTRCRDFQGATFNQYKQYINRESDLDPILKFHVSKGAHVVDIVPQYRPGDSENLGNGVLVCYSNLESTVFKRLTPSPVEKPQLSTVSAFALNDLFRAALGSGLPYSPSTSFMELGFDSADLLILREKISALLTWDVESNIFFRYPSPQDIIDHICTSSVHSGSLIHISFRFELNPFCRSCPTKSCSRTWCKSCHCRNGLPLSRGFYHEGALECSLPWA